MRIHEQHPDNNAVEHTDGGHKNLQQVKWLDCSLSQAKTAKQLESVPYFGYEQHPDNNAVEHTDGGHKNIQVKWLDCSLSQAKTAKQLESVPYSRLSPIHVLFTVYFAIHGLFVPWSPYCYIVPMRRVPAADEHPPRFPSKAQ